jgi:hypothetical protein
LLGKEKNVGLEEEEMKKKDDEEHCKVAEEEPVKINEDLQINVKRKKSRWRGGKNPKKQPKDSSDVGAAECSVAEKNSVVDEMASCSRPEGNNDSVGNVEDDKLEKDVEANKAMDTASPEQDIRPEQEVKVNKAITRTYSKKGKVVAYHPTISARGRAAVVDVDHQEASMGGVMIRNDIYIDHNYAGRQELDINGDELLVLDYFVRRGDYRYTLWQEENNKTGAILEASSMKTLMNAKEEVNAEVIDVYLRILEQEAEKVNWLKKICVLRSGIAVSWQSMVVFNAYALFFLSMISLMY